MKERARSQSIDASPVPPVEALKQKWRDRCREIQAAANNAFASEDYIAEKFLMLELSAVNRCLSELAGIKAIPSPQMWQPRDVAIIVSALQQADDDSVSADDYIRICGLLSAVASPRGGPAKE